MDSPKGTLVINDEDIENVGLLSDYSYGNGETKKKDHGHGHGHGDKKKDHGHGHGHGDKKKKDHGHGHGHGDKKKDHGHGHGHGDKKKKEHGHGHGHGHGFDEEEHDDHDHDDHGDEEDDLKKSNRKAMIALYVAVGFTFIFMIGEVIGGYIAGSLAIMTDAAHLLTDIASMALSITAIHLSSRAPTHKSTYGFHRAEILGALASVLMIWALVAILMYEAIYRLVDDARLEGADVDGRLMSAIGAAGFLVNVVDALILWWGNAPHGHSHGGGGHDHGGHGHGGHGHGGHGHGGNVNVRAALIHVIGDCIQSIGVVISGLIILLGTYFTLHTTKKADSYFNLADPIASMLFGVVTLFTTFKLLAGIVSVLMERVPEGIDYFALLDELEERDEITEVHDLHIWALTMGKNCLSVHLIAPDHQAALRAAKKVCKKWGINHSTIQVDTPDDKCVKVCSTDLLLKRRRILANSQNH